MRPLILSSTFWALAIVTITIALRIVPMGRLTGKASGSTLQDLRMMRLGTWVLMVGGLTNIGLRLTAGYINPRDYVQDYVAASQFLVGATMYPADFPKRAVSALEVDFPGKQQLAATVVFGDEFTRMHESAPANAHPPILGMALAGPVAVGGLRGSYLLVAGSLLVLLLASVRAILRELGWQPVGLLWMAIVGLLLGWHPVNSAIRSAQPGILIFGCVTAGWLALRRERSASAGIWFGLAASIQAFPLLLVAYTLLRDRRAFVSAILLMTGVTALAIIVAPDGSYAQWSATMSWIAPKFVTAPENVSLVGLVIRAGLVFGLALPTGIVTLLTMAVTLGSFGVLFVTKRPAQSHPIRRDIEVAIVVALMVALSPLSWSRYFPILLLPLAVLIRQTLVRESRSDVLWLLLALLAISVPDGTITAAHQWLVLRELNVLAFVPTLCFPLGTLGIAVRLAKVYVEPWRPLVPL